MRSRLLMAALALSLLATAWVASRDESEAPPATARSSKPQQAALPTGWPAALSAAATNADGPAWPAPEPLARQSWGLAAEPSAALATVAAEPVAAPKAKAADIEVQAPSAAPPIAYQLLGRMDEAGRPRIVLSNAQRTLVLGVGELIDEQWRVDAIGPSGAQLLWLAGGQKQNLAYSSP
jgi:hypothetical protein